MTVLSKLNIKPIQISETQLNSQPMGRTTSKALLLSILFLSTVSAAKDIVLLAGGFGSCPWASDPSEMRMWKPLKKAIVGSDQEYSLDTQRSSLVIRACYSMSNLAVSYDVLNHTREVRYLENDSLEIVSEFTKMHNDIASTKELAEQIGFYLAIENKENSVTLIGQSLGGDLVLDLADLLAKRYSATPELTRPFVNLVTIDPISKKGN